MRTRSPAVLVVAFGLFGLGALSARSAFADSTSGDSRGCSRPTTVVRADSHASRNMQPRQASTAEDLPLSPMR